jgi:hypothetical protein
VAAREQAVTIEEDLEKLARERYVRWDPALWRSLVEHAAKITDEKVRASYLALGAEGIGLGYLFPPAAGADGFLTLAWMRLLPSLLPALPPREQAETIARCWNLGENLERAPAWVRRIFLRLARDLKDLGELDRIAARVAEALESPPTKLGDTGRGFWIPLFDEDRRFLPGAVHFVAPQVVCVHDRSRPTSVGVWLASPPLVLGPMGCAEKIEAAPAGPIWAKVEASDPRFAEPIAAAQNEWRAAAVLATSQFLVALLP